MFTAILAFFQAIPSLMGGINNFTNKYYDAKVQITTARVGGDVNVAKALVAGVVAEGQTRVEFLRVVSQSKFLMFIVGGFAIPWIAFEWKVVIWDTMLGWGTTPPVRGLVAEWSGIILGGVFGTGGAMAIGQMFFNRKER